MYLEFGTPLFDEYCKDMIHKLILKWIRKLFGFQEEKPKGD
jgi:hypothetical protein